MLSGRAKRYSVPLALLVMCTALILAGCGPATSDEVQVLPTLAPDAGVEEPDSTTDEQQTEETEEPEAEVTPTPEGDDEDDEDKDDEEELDDLEVLQNVTQAIESSTSQPLETVFKDGAEIVGRTTCTGVADQSTNYPIAQEVIMGPPGEAGSGTPRVIIRTYPDAATAKQATRARIQSLETCVERANQAAASIDWGIGTLAGPAPGEQLWLPAGAETEVHNAYAIENFYVVTSIRTAPDKFTPGKPDAWTRSVVKEVIENVKPA